MKTKINVFYMADGIETTHTPETSEKQSEVDATVDNIPGKGEPKNSPKNKFSELSVKIEDYKNKIKEMPDGEEKTRLETSLKTVKDFVNRNLKLGEKTLKDVLEDKTTKYKEFLSALKALSSKFDKKEVKELTEEEKMKKLEEDYGVKIEKTDMGIYVLYVDKTEYTLSSLKGVEEKINELGLKKQNEIKVSKEELEKLKNMSNSEFLKYSPEERLKYITKEHADAKTLKENDELTFTFTFDGVYNQDLWRKTTAGQTLPSQVNMVKVGETEYKRRGLKGEFFTEGGGRLVINEGTHITVGKELSQEEMEKMKNKNEMIYKAYMGELKKEEVPEEKQKDFFDKDGNLLEKYKLTDKEKELFKTNRYLVEESIARDIDPKFAVNLIPKIVKNNASVDGLVKIEDIFTEIDRQRGKFAGPLADKEDFIKVATIRAVMGYGWEKTAKELGIKDSVVSSLNERTSSYMGNIDIKEIPEGIKGFLTFIGMTENSVLNYEAIYKRANSKMAFEKPLSELTVREVMQRQAVYKRKYGDNKSAAIGAYQFMDYNLDSMIKKGWITGNEKFTPELQDKLALTLLVRKRGLNAFLSGKISTEQFAHNLSCEWASFPDPFNGGKSHYDGDGINHSRTSLGNVLSMLNKLKTSLNGPIDLKKGIPDSSPSNKESSQEVLAKKDSVILEFNKGSVDSQLSKLLNNSELVAKIKEEGNVFIFRGKSNLTGEEMTKITSTLKTIDSNIKIFVDQEGGKVNRFKDFKGEKESDTFVQDALANLKINNKPLQKLLDKLLNGEYFPSLAKLGKIYDKLPDNLKDDYLKAITYIRLSTLQKKGVNTYGLVADLNAGNPVIDNNNRSFSSNPDSYKKFAEAMIDNAKELNMGLYLKHFPGHGAGKVDTHLGVLTYTKSDNNYLDKNITLFEDLVDYGKQNGVEVGLMTGHIVLPDEYKGRVEKVLSKANYTITDDMGMGGYRQIKDGIKKVKEGEFLVTDYVLAQPDTIKLDKKDTKTVL